MTNQMSITVETGEKKVINVFDILDGYAFGKQFIIYNFEDDPDRLYASILNETETTVSFDPISDPNEIEYISAEIERVASELDNTL